MYSVLQGHKKKELGEVVWKKYEAVTTELQRMNRCPRGRHHRRKGPKWWKTCEQNYTCTKGQNKYHPHVGVTSRYYDITSDIS